MNLYNALMHLRPEWASAEDDNVEALWMVLNQSELLCADWMAA